MILHKAGSIVVLARWPASGLISALGSNTRLRIRSMSACRGVRIMLRMPEQTAVERDSVRAGVIDINIDDVSGEIVCELKPFPITTPQKMSQCAVNQCVFIIVMGY